MKADIKHFGVGFFVFSVNFAPDNTYKCSQKTINYDKENFTNEKGIAFRLVCPAAGCGWDDENVRIRFQRSLRNWANAVLQHYGC